MYKLDFEHNGWPVLKSTGGKYCYRHGVKDWWILNSEHHVARTTVPAHIVAPDGLLPVGAHAWTVWVASNSTLTVALLVRSRPDHVVSSLQS